MDKEEERSILISDILKIEDYFNVEEIEPSKDNGLYGNMDFEILEHVHYMNVQFLLDYKIFGKPYPSVLEVLKCSNPKIINCIENHKDELRQEFIRSHYMPTLFSNNKNRDEYCEACHQSPCMCSDREATSTIHDF